MFDTELGWGSIENGRLAERERDGVFTRCRSLLPSLLDELRTLECPTTWAVVGALVGPDPRDRLDHLPPGRTEAVARALADARPDSLAWPGLLDRLDALPGAEIGCHGYSHTRLDFPGLTAAAVSTELERWREATGVATNGLSMVCPRDTIAFLGPIAEAGVRTVRLPPGYVSDTPWTGRRLRWPAPSGTVRLDVEGATMTGVEGTLFFRGGPGTSGRLRLVYSWLRARHALDRHPRTVLWVHPFNFGESEGLLPAFGELVRRLARARDAGDVELVTLSGLGGAP